MCPNRHDDPSTESEEVQAFMRPQAIQALLTERDSKPRLATFVSAADQVVAGLLQQVLKEMVSYCSCIAPSENLNIDNWVRKVLEAVPTDERSVSMTYGATQSTNFVTFQTRRGIRWELARRLPVQVQRLASVAEGHRSPAQGDRRRCGGPRSRFG